MYREILCVERKRSGVLWLPVVWFPRLVHEDLAYCSLAVGQKIFEEEKLLLLLLLLLLLPYPRRYKTKQEENGGSHLQAEGINIQRVSSTNPSPPILEEEEE